MQRFMICAILVLLAACGGTVEPQAPSIVAATIPADWQRIELPQVVFALPPDWATLSPDDIQPLPDATAIGLNPQWQTLIDQGRLALANNQAQLVAFDLNQSTPAATIPASLRVGEQRFSQPPTLDAVSDANEADLRATEGFSAIERAAMQLGGIDATRLRSRLTIVGSNGEPLVLAIEQYLLVRADSLTIVTLTTSPDVPAVQRAVYDQILATIQLRS